jgi:hypothetical protein
VVLHDALDVAEQLDVEVASPNFDIVEGVNLLLCRELPFMLVVGIVVAQILEGLSSSSMFEGHVSILIAVMASSLCGGHWPSGLNGVMFEFELGDPRPCVGLAL